MLRRKRMIRVETHDIRTRVLVILLFLSFFLFSLTINTNNNGNTHTHSLSVKFSTIVGQKTKFCLERSRAKGRGETPSRRADKPPSHRADRPTSRRYAETPTSRVDPSEPSQKPSERGTRTASYIMSNRQTIRSGEQNDRRLSLFFSYRILLQQTVLVKTSLRLNK